MSFNGKGLVPTGLFYFFFFKLFFLDPQDFSFLDQVLGTLGFKNTSY